MPLAPGVVDEAGLLLAACSAEVAREWRPLVSGDLRELPRVVVSAAELGWPFDLAVGLLVESGGAELASTVRELVAVGAVRRLRALADRAAESPAPAGALRVLADGCRAVGQFGCAVRVLAALARHTLADPAGLGRGDLAVWDELVATIDERPYRFPRRPFRSAFENPDADLDATALVVAHLALLPGTVPGLIAVDLLLQVGRRERWASPWPERLALWAAHPDPDVREAAGTIRTDLIWTAPPE